MFIRTSIKTSITQVNSHWTLVNINAIWCCKDLGRRKWNSSSDVIRDRSVGTIMVTSLIRTLMAAIVQVRWLGPEGVWRHPIWRPGPPCCMTLLLIHDAVRTVIDFHAVKCDFLGVDIGDNESCKHTLLGNSSLTERLFSTPAESLNTIFFFIVVLFGFLLLFPEFDISLPTAVFTVPIPAENVSQNWRTSG